MRVERAKLTKCDTGEWDEKLHHSSVIRFEWSHG